VTGETIEEVRKAEFLMLGREEVYRQILDAIADMILVKGAHSRILWANKSFRDYYGMSNEELQELVDAPFNAPDNTQQYVADDLLVYTTGRTLEIPVEPVTRQDGVVNLFHTVKSAIVAGDGRVRMTVGVSRNIGETLELREQLLRYREQLKRDRLSSFAAQLPGFLFQARSTGGSVQYTFVSEGVFDYYGIRPAALVSDPNCLFMNVASPEETRAEVESAIRFAAENGGSIQHIHQARGADGCWRWMELLTRAQGEADGSVTFHGYVHDVSARHQNEREREELVEKLTARNQEMEQFTYTISHDLKSPLFTIRGFLDGIEDDIRSGRSERALTDLGRVRAAAEKMSRMLAELLELSRVGRVGHNPVLVGALDWAYGSGPFGNRRY
jgi:PAS domain S-box-containing protein